MDDVRTNPSQYSFSLGDAAFFEYAWNKVCIFQALFDYGTTRFDLEYTHIYVYNTWIYE